MKVRFLSCLVLATAALGVARATAASAPAAASSPIIELPKFVVTDSRELPPPESWRYAQIPGLEVLSTISESRTRVFVRDFQRLQQVIEMVWPAILRGPPPLPAMLILCGRGNAFESFVPPGPADRATRPTSLFLQEMDRAAIVVDFVTERLDEWSIPTLAEPSNEESAPSDRFLTEHDPHREFYLQYFRSVIRRGGGEVPPWLEEGLVQLLASVQFSRNAIAVGRLRDGAGGQRADEFTVRLRRQALMDFGRLFAPEPRTGFEAAIYAPQCYAFVHLCLYGQKGRYQRALEKLVQRAGAGPVTEQMFKECFGLGYEEMGAMLRTHVSYGEHHYVELRAAGRGTALLDEPPAFTVRAATPAEIGRIKGETYRMGGHHEQARLALIAPYVRGEHDGPLLAALGLQARAGNDLERARKFLAAAVQAGVVRPRVYLELARLRLADAKLAAGRGPTLDPAARAAVLAPLLIGVQQAPPMAEIYELIGEMRAQADTPPTAAELDVLYTGVERFPRRLRLVYLTAALALRHGDRARARVLIAHGLAIAGEAEPARHFQALQAQLP